MAYEVVMSYHLHMPSYFLGTFTEYPYIFSLKIERFAQLLLTSNAPISTVAESVGINNLKNLSRQFKALKNISPYEYRKRHQIMSDCYYQAKDCSSIHFLGN